MEKPIVTIILATYNGEAFLPDLLASLCLQTCRPDRLVLRDDGSSDRSVEIVHAWAMQNGVQLQEIVGERLGPAKNFITALQAADDADIYLFCDQDDVWVSSKIAQALEQVPWGANARPTLYASTLEVVDEQLQYIHRTAVPKVLAFSSAVCESVLTGCTMAFNAAFRDLVGSKVPKHVAMHDWWFYLLATGAQNADLLFDARPTVLYRQHGMNVLGAGKKGLSVFMRRIYRFGNERHIRSQQLYEFFNFYQGLLDEFPRRLIAQLTSGKLGFWRRCRIACSVKIRRQEFLATLFTRLTLLLNRF